jgi:hypothetical protein
MPVLHQPQRGACAIAVVLSTVAVLGQPRERALAGPPLFPVPVGTHSATVMYDDGAPPPAAFSATLPYHGPGASLNDIEYFPGSSNLGAFTSFNTLGRRTEVIPLDPAVQAPNETLMRHGFYKFNSGNQINVDDDFFAGIDVEGNVTVKIENITFDRPVQVRQKTFLLHMLWDIDQVDMLEMGGHHGHAYNAHHNLHLIDGFRNFSSFFLGGSPEFVSHPANFALGDINPVVTHDAPNVIDVEITFPYRLLTHLEDMGMGIPDGVDLPAPGGFLEPWHFHLEYLVVPEPGSLALLAGGALLLRRRRRVV